MQMAWGGVSDVRVIGREHDDIEARADGADIAPQGVSVMAGIQVKGLDAVTRQIRHAINGVKKRVTLYRRIGTALVAWIDRNFMDEGTEQRWEPLAAGTLFARRKGGVGAKILQNNGLLRASHTYEASAGKVVVGFPNNRIAEYHHWGTPGPYEIRPRNAKALMFFAPPGTGGAGRTTIIKRKKGAPKVGLANKSGSKQSVIFATHVMHPGLKARPLLPSVPLAETLVAEVINEYVEELLKPKDASLKPEGAS
jgi:phage gpG-like protein